MPATLLKKETLAQVLSCEFCEISKNTFFTGNLLSTASLNKREGETGMNYNGNGRIFTLITIDLEERPQNANLPFFFLLDDSTSNLSFSLNAVSILPIFLACL